MASDNKVGRPTLYKEEYNERVYKLCLLGAKDTEIADFFDISEATLNNWKIEYPLFLESIKSGKVDADIKVANSLYNRALGYDQKTDKIFQFQGEPVIVPTVEHVQPDTTAQIFWLKNRQPKQWRDKQEIESTNLNTNLNINEEDSSKLLSNATQQELEKLAAGEMGMKERQEIINRS